jgi:hypothetical protein
LCAVIANSACVRAIAGTARAPSSSSSSRARLEKRRASARRSRDVDPRVERARPQRAKRALAVGRHRPRRRATRRATRRARESHRAARANANANANAHPIDRRVVTRRRVYRRGDRGRRRSASQRIARRLAMPPKKKQDAAPAEEEEEELLDYDDVADAAETAVAPTDDGATDGKDAAKKGYVGIHSTGFRDFLLKPELLRAIVDCGFEHPSEGEISVKLMELERARVGESRANRRESATRTARGGARARSDLEARASERRARGLTAN